MFLANIYNPVKSNVLKVLTVVKDLLLVNPALECIYQRCTYSSDVVLSVHKATVLLLSLSTFYPSRAQSVRILLVTVSPHKVWCRVYTVDLDTL